MRNNGIFEPKRRDYVFIGKNWSPTITDKEGNQLAKTDGKSLIDNSGSLILKMDLKKSTVSVSGLYKKYFIDYEITDSEGKIVGNFQQEDELSFLRNSNGEDLVIGEFTTVLGIPYGINN